MDFRKSLVSQYSEVDVAPVYFKTPVLWGHMDAAQHVNNLVYLKWTETARVIYFEKMKLDISFGGALGAILGWQDAKYIFPVNYPDEVLITAIVTELRTDRFVMECRVYSKKHQRLALISKQEIIPFNYVDQKKIALPQQWIDQINILQPKSPF